MPGIPYASPAIEADALLFGGRDRDYWQRGPDHLDSSRRIPLVAIRNCQPEIQAARSKSRSKLVAVAAAPTTIHGPATVLMSSSDSENDLAAMVHDFMENGGDGYDSSDKESPTPTGFAVFFEKLKAFISTASPVEKELRSAVIRILCSMTEDRMDGLCHRGIDCNGRCLRSFLVKRLRKAGYDAGICKSRWQSVGRVPGGEYEYIDVETSPPSGSGSSPERLIVDLDFQSHFEIARPIQSYRAAVRILPAPLVATPRRLRQVLQVMSDAAKFSLKQNAMHLPPWRTFDYVSAKWLSPYDREIGLLGPGSDRAAAVRASDGSSKNTTTNNNRDNNSGVVADRKGCYEQLKRTKACLAMDRCAPATAARAQSRGRHNSAAATSPEYQRRSILSYIE
ncbi:uncharacterized protein LOC9636730 [Selaginella moellendorffii]|nr:uncharacterized protein LOC9636730 [Selaginella moellendorffii]XP_024535394.1 uncharacterized protein LOC9636730 [Selaginella moellendorffii]|eukprot:XP_002974803.2 uncharacterized protein LOC9636730 [Selaginella moellendorffii]